MITKPYIPKEHQDLPDCYGILISYNDGKKESLDITGHDLIDKVTILDQNNRIIEWKPNPNPMLQLILFDDEVLIISMAYVKSFKLDKRWTKIRAIKSEITEDNKKK